MRMNIQIGVYSCNEIPFSKRKKWKKCVDKFLKHYVGAKEARHRRVFTLLWFHLLGVLKMGKSRLCSRYHISGCFGWKGLNTEGHKEFFCVDG